MHELTPPFADHNKYPTYWYSPEERKPVTVAEHAVDLLRTVTFPGDSYARKKIAGAKYWFQSRPTGEDITTHFDKDEGLASQQAILRFPAYASVLYLQSYGGPTVLWNQTIVGHQSVSWSPTLPRQAWVIYPKRNM